MTLLVERLNAYSSDGIYIYIYFISGFPFLNCACIWFKPDYQFNFVAEVYTGNIRVLVVSQS